jgi:hypothetical protein
VAERANNNKAAKKRGKPMRKPTTHQALLEELLVFLLPPKEENMAEGSTTRECQSAPITKKRQKKAWQIHEKYPTTHQALFVFLLPLQKNRDIVTEGSTTG